MVEATFAYVTRGRHLLNMTISLPLVSPAV
jgi:hypothetical protein